MFGMSPLSALCAALLVGFAAGGTSAWKVQGWRHDAEKAQQLQEARRIDGKRQSVSAEVDAKHAKTSERIRTITEVQIREVPTYVSANDCPMSPGFRVLHDAAAVGELPDPAGIADAAAVPTPEIAATVVYNYGSCTETADRLRGLQEWVRAQGAVK